MSWEAMKKWAIDHLLGPIIVGLIVAALNLYVDVQVLKKGEAVLREELSDLWEQTNNAVQKR